MTPKNYYSIWKSKNLCRNIFVQIIRSLDRLQFYLKIGEIVSILRIATINHFSYIIVYYPMFANLFENSQFQPNIHILRYIFYFRTKNKNEFYRNCLFIKDCLLSNYRLSVHIYNDI